MVNAPQVSLKVIVVAHLILTVWASMAETLLPASYIYLNAFILAFGIWAIIAPDSTDSILMFLVLNLWSIIMDIIFLAIFTPNKIHTSTFQFSLAMAIINLLLRPFTSFVMYRLYQDRGGNYSDFGIPGMPNFGGGSPGAQQSHGYENIDQPVPSNSMDSGSPGHMPGYDKSPLP